LAVDPGAHAIWIGDLAIEVPAMLIGGVLLWLRQPLGYVVGAGLLFQFGLTPFGLAAMLAAHALLNAGPIDAATIAGVLVFGLVALAPLAYFLRGGRDLRTMAVPSALQGDTVRGME
jgi:hypothetical protein